MTLKNRNLKRETGSLVDREPLKIGLVKASFQSGRTERLENDKASVCAGGAEVSCVGESNGPHGMSFLERLILCGLDAELQTARARFSPGIHGLRGIVLAALVLAMAGDGAPVQAQASTPSPASTTVVVFADRPMRGGQWNGLFAALRVVMASGGAETEPLGDDAEFVRGDLATAGFRVQTAIVVYLHGDCNLVPLPKRTAYSVPLGWVRKVEGRIEPFVHVDCTRIEQVLGPQAMGLDAERRNSVMAGAIARVIMHEWIHIASQTSSHSERGIEKAQYGVADLMAGKEWQGAAQIRRP